MFLVRRCDCHLDYLSSTLPLMDFEEDQSREYLIIFQDSSKMEVEATSPEEAIVFAQAQKIMRKPTVKNLKGEHEPSTTVADVIEGEII